MRNRTRKIWVSIGVCSILLGVIIFGGLMTMLKWDFSRLTTAKLETVEYEISETFSDISVQADVEDIRFALSDDGKCKVVCQEEKKVTHAVSVQEGALVIKTVNEKSWYDYIRLRFAASKITVYLPNAEYDALSVRERTGDVEIAKELRFQSIDVSVSTGDVACYASTTGAVNVKTTTGEVCVENVGVGSLNISVSTGEVSARGIVCNGEVAISVSTGEVSATDIQCQRFSSTGSTGDISLKNVVATENISIQRDTGDVSFNGCDAGELFVETTTGDVTGTLLSEKVFVAKTDTGKVKVPQTEKGGRCEITTDTGDIKITIK